MTPAEAQHIVMDFSDRLARVALPKVVVRSAVLPSSQKTLDSIYSRRLLPYSKEQAVCAFKTYYVSVPDAAAANLALLMLHQWVVLLLADELEEPLTFDDVGRDYALREGLVARLVAEQATLESIRNLNHLSPSANAHLLKCQ